MYWLQSRLHLILEAWQHLKALKIGIKKRLILVWGLTCVRCAGVKQRVCVGDKLQLSVQVRQEAAGQSHVHLAITFNSHPVYLCCHVQWPQRGSDVYLQWDGKKRNVEWKDSRSLKYGKIIKTQDLLSSSLWEGRVRPGLKAYDNN